MSISGGLHRSTKNIYIEGSLFYTMLDGDYKSKIINYYRIGQKGFLYIFQNIVSGKLPHNPFVERHDLLAKRTLTAKGISCSIVIALLISLFTPFALVTASPGLVVQIPQPIVAPNQPVYIEYFTALGEDGTIQMDITKPPLLAIFWQSGPMPITGGLLNSITAPGFNDPGTYIVSASVSLTGGGGTLTASASFEVVAGGQPQPGQPGQPGPGFDFNLEVNPPIREVERGDTAHYEIIVIYSDPVYSGTPIQLHISGLGPDMEWHSTPTGQISITTSPNTPPGTYMIEIVGEAQGIAHQTTATLIVREGPPEPPPEEPPPEEHLPEEPPPEEHPPEEHPPEDIPPEEHPPEQPEEGYYPPEQPDEGYREGGQPEESGLAAVISNPLYLIIFLLIIVIVVLVIVLRKPTQTPPPSSTKYCSKCGAPLKPGDSFCSSCGERV